MTNAEMIAQVKTKMVVVESEISKNRHLSIVYSAYDREALPKLDEAHRQLQEVLVDLYQQLTDLERVA